MLICLIIAILATLIWINVTVAEIANGKNIEASHVIKTARVKTALVAIAALFWAIVIRYGIMV